MLLSQSKVEKMNEQYQNDRAAQHLYESTYQQMFSVVPWCSLDEPQKNRFRLAESETVEHAMSLTC